MPNLGDITTVNWDNVPGVCVLTAGFPVKDVSVAGLRTGLADGTRSGLWHHVVRAIEALNPCLVVIQNVRGLLSSPLATWNPAIGVWETPQASLLCEHSVPYSAPWPTSGSMHAGACFAPPTPAPRTDENGSSSPPGPHGGPLLLKTPTSNLATNGGSQHPAKRKEGGHGPNLADEVEWLLSTPVASDGSKGSPNQRHGNGDLTLPSAAARLRHLSGAQPMRTARERKQVGSGVSLTELLPLFEEPTVPEGGPRSGGRTPPPAPDGRQPLASSPTDR
ncbi:DNA cytosine methyltransferase [Streptomyces sp. 2314.4]|uniref:DNA cytosine methyltransferase n=1 Tax=Streptomyces sp. 2314.4 TaxID=1881025 RepID=UPI000B3070BF